MNKLLSMSFLVLALLVSGCTAPLKKMSIPTEHVVMYDSAGHPLNPTGNMWGAIPHDPGMDMTEKYHLDYLPSYPEENHDQYESHINRIITRLTEAHNTKKINKIMLYIHGGLNTHMESVERLINDPATNETCHPNSINCYPRYKRILDANYFPIFINWKSSLFSSYWENLFAFRQGESRPWTAPLTAPFVFVTDIGRSILSWPIVSGNLIANDINTIPYSSAETEYPNSVAKELLCRHQYSSTQESYEQCLNVNDGLKFRRAPYPCPFVWSASKPQLPSLQALPDGSTTALQVGEDKRECGELLMNFAIYFPTLPFKLVTTPVVDALGTSSWEVMLRHVDLLFHDEDELRKSHLTNYHTDMHSLATMPKQGGLSIFLQELAKKINSEPDAHWEIELIGHSMGTIVANQIIREFGDQLPIKNIVYLASATTLHDYEDTIYPYLREHQDSHIYHFMLHPRAEEGESMGYEFSSRGSLLVWIDNFLNKPLSPMGRTAGRYDNFLSALHDADLDIKNRISFRVYSAGKAAEATNPQTHSDVAARFAFWKESCWEPDKNDGGCIFPSH